MRPSIRRGTVGWRYRVPLADGGWAVGAAVTWRSAYERVCEIARRELRKQGIEL